MKGQVVSVSSPDAKTAGMLMMRKTQPTKNITAFLDNIIHPLSKNFYIWLRFHYKVKRPRKAYPLFFFLTRLLHF
jgi:hypothetical protein